MQWIEAKIAFDHTDNGLAADLISGVTKPFLANSICVSNIFISPCLKQKKGSERCLLPFGTLFYF